MEPPPPHKTFSYATDEEQIEFNGLRNVGVQTSRMKRGKIGFSDNIGVEDIEDIEHELEMKYQAVGRDYCPVPPFIF